LTTRSVAKAADNFYCVAFVETKFISFHWGLTLAVTCLSVSTSQSLCFFKQWWTS